jgi:hypothetical protein
MQWRDEDLARRQGLKLSRKASKLHIAIVGKAYPGLTDPVEATMQEMCDEIIGIATRIKQNQITQHGSS